MNFILPLKICSLHMRDRVGKRRNSKNIVLRKTKKNFITADLCNKILWNSTALF